MRLKVLAVMTLLSFMISLSPVTNAGAPGCYVCWEKTLSTGTTSVKESFYHETGAARLGFVGGNNAVSLVKIADLATVSLGPAFFMFAALVVVTVAQDQLVCRWSVWRSISHV